MLRRLAALSLFAFITSMAGCGTEGALLRQTPEESTTGLGSHTGASPVEEPVGATFREPWDRKVVKSADLEMETRNVEKGVSEITIHAQAMGGFVQSSERGEGYASLTVRIPVAMFETTLTRLGELGKVTSQRLYGQDVTEIYYDLELRIATTEKLLARMIELLAKAGSIQDSLAIEREIGRLTTELESMKGRLTRLTDAVAFSTLNVRLSPPDEGFPGPITIVAMGTLWVVKKLFWID